MNKPISDELIHIISAVPIRGKFTLAIVLRVRIDSIDVGPIFNDVYLECLKMWRMRRENCTTSYLFKQYLLAAQEGYVDLETYENLKHDYPEAEASLEVPPDQMLYVIAASILPDFSEFFFLSLGVRRVDLEQAFPVTRWTNQNIRNNVLMEWRRINVGSNTVRDLITQLESSASTVRLTTRELSDVKSSVVEHMNKEPVLFHSIVKGCDSVSEINKCLRDQYATILETVSPLPWLDLDELKYTFNEMFINLRTRKLPTRQDSERDTPIFSINDLFVQNNPDMSNLGSVQHLLLLGNPGSGKSTICDRLAYQWAQRDTITKGLNGYQLVILIRACFIRVNDSTIYDYIRRELLPDIPNVRVIEKQRMLLIIDGYDELSGNKKVVTDLLDKKLSAFENSSIILTSRHGQRINKKFNSKCIFDIVNLTPDDVTQFIEKFNRTKETNLKELDITRHPLGTLLTTPLFLWFYVILEADLFDNTGDLSRTIFFTNIVDGIMSKAVERLKHENQCIAGFANLKKIAYQCICSDQLHFEDRLTDIEAQLGFVKKSKGISKRIFQENNVYSFTHKSIMEFLAAQYISEQEDTKVCEMLDHIPEIRDETRRRSSFVVFFICGFINKSEQFTEVFSKYVPTCEETVKLMEHTEDHFGIQCIAEIRDVSIMDVSWRGCVRKDVVLNGSDCSQYCAMGLRQLIKLPDYMKHHLNHLTLLYEKDNVSNILGDNKVVHELIIDACHNTLNIYGDLRICIWEAILEYYNKARLDEIIIGLRPPQHPVTDYVVTMQELSKHQSISSTLTRMSVKCINQTQINNLIHLLKHTNISYLKYHERLRKDDDESDLWRTLTSHCGSLRELRLVRSISRVKFQRHIEENMFENEKRQWEERVVVS